MQQALEQLAIQAGVSILADGEPEQKSHRFEKQLEASCKAEDALTQIAEAFNYSWSVSKSGFVLMRKRFTDEHERPEVVPDELSASIQVIFGFLRPFYTPQPGVSMTNTFRRLTADLSPDERNLLNSGDGLPLSVLNPSLREQAMHLICMNELNSMSLRLEGLNKILAALPGSRLMTNNVLFVGGKTEPYIVLALNQAAVTEPVLLWSLMEKNVGPSAQPTIPAPARVAKSLGLYQAHTVHESLLGLQDRFQITITLLPKVQAYRRILLLLRDADASHAPAAFAEMYGWRLQQKNEHAYFLYRRAIEPPRDASELGKAILKALPADISRCLFARPITLNGEMYVDDHDRFPQLPGKGDARSFAITKIYIHYRMALHALRGSFADDAFSKPIPYSALSVQQQQDLLYSLWTFAAGQFADDLWKITYKPPSYMTDPMHTRLINKGDGSFGIIGAGGGSVVVREGPSSN